MCQIIMIEQLLKIGQAIGENGYILQNLGRDVMVLYSSNTDTHICKEESIPRVAN